MNGGLADIATLMEGLGKGLVVEPVLGHVLLAGRLLDRCGSEAAREQWLDGLISGTRSLALAHRENAGEPPAILRAGCLTGNKSFVLDACGVDALVVTCRDEASRLTIAVVPADADGVRLSPFRLADGSWMADVSFDAVKVDPGLISDYSPEMLADLIVETSIGASAEMVGVMQRLFDDTVAYVRTRQQFGQPIGKFQSVQHRAARMYIALEQSRSLMLKAALTPQHDAAWLPAARSCQAFIAEAALELAHDAVQLHGGIGITDEVAVSFGHRRIMVLRALFADTGPFALPPDAVPAEAA